MKDRIIAILKEQKNYKMGYEQLKDAIGHDKRFEIGQALRELKRGDRVFISSKWHGFVILRLKKEAK